MSAPRYPFDRSAHDGKDLRVVVAEGQFDQPPAWPQDPWAPLAVVAPTFMEPDREALSQRQWGMIQKHDARLTHMQCRSTSWHWLGAAMHFDSGWSFRFWVETGVAACLEGYFTWRSASGIENDPNTDNMLRIAFLKDRSLNRNFVLEGEYPVGQGDTDPDTLGMQTIAAAARLINAYLDRFPPADGAGEDRQDRFFGVHTDHFLLAVATVKYYWTSRTQPGPKYVFERPRGSVRPRPIMKRLTDEQKHLGPVGADEPSIACQATPIMQRAAEV